MHNYERSPGSQVGEGQRDGEVRGRVAEGHGVESLAWQLDLWTPFEVCTFQPVCVCVCEPGRSPHGTEREKNDPRVADPHWLHHSHMHFLILWQFISMHLTSDAKMSNTVFSQQTRDILFSWVLCEGQRKSEKGWEKREKGGGPF
jgi:hypothetical protein